jgi:phosphatidylglycerol lysyltransferase
MKANVIFQPFIRFFKEHSLPFIRENGKLIAQFILTLFFIGIAIWFVKHEKGELQQVRHVLTTARWQVVLIGTGLTAFYILLQGLMYKSAFASVHCKVPLGTTIMLFMRRNFISVFLPAGGVSSLAFFTGDIEKRAITRTQIHFASSVYAFVGILSVVIVAIPTFIYALAEGSLVSGEVYALIATALLIVILYLAYRSLMTKGIIYRWLLKIAPVAEVFLEDLRNKKIKSKFFLLTVLCSVLIEAAGISLLYIAMYALHFNASLFAAVMAYIVSVIFMIVSPFLRGLGAVEVSMTFILIRFGYLNVEAIAITLLYRFFEFWLPLASGALSFLLKINRLLMRIVPAIMLFILGIINIISVLTPAIMTRLERLQNFLPMDAINASNYFVMVAGLFLLVTAAFMLKGLRSAWWYAVFLSILSIIGHLTKAVDYEEATVALIVLIVLISTRKEYYIRANPKLRSIGLQTALLSMLAVLLYGTIGFYFLDKKHFNIDFSILESIRYTLRYYFLLGSPDLVTADNFAKHFLLSINISGFMSIAFIIYAFIRPYVMKKTPSEEEMTRAKSLIQQFGKSGMDYFKTYNDKTIYAPLHLNAFIAYRVAGNYAVALEDPVADSRQQMMQCIAAFDKYCYESGLKSIYYRVPEESLEIYEELGKKNLFLGQEGVIGLESFTLSGTDRKTLRHSINRVTESGYKATIQDPPIKDGLLQKIKSVSDEWLENSGRSEIIFSQGIFDWEELKKQTLITVENPEEKIVAFLNIIPDYAKGETTYDLLRKSGDAPNGTTEFLIIKLCEYSKSLNFRYVNLGFAPMSGLDDPHTFPEKSMRFAYEKIRSFYHYKGLREFKERFFPVWFNKYLIYDHDYDLLQMPVVLAKVIKQ